MDTTEARTLVTTAINQALANLESGLAPTIVAEALYDATVTASQLLTSGPSVTPDDQTLVETLGRTMLKVGYAQLNAHRDDTRKLDAILRSTRMVLGKEPYSAALQQALDDAYQDWHWHGH